MKKIDVSLQETNNPAILKFEANSFLTQYESFEFNNIDEAKNSPLAQQLFYLPFVKKIISFKKEKLNLLLPLFQLVLIYH